MSNGHPAHAVPTSEDVQIGAKWQPRRWSLWSHARPVVVYILLVEAAALALVAITARLAPITPKSLLWLGLLTVGVVIHKEASRAIERIREIGREGSPHTNLQSIWFFAAILMLPLPLATAVAAFSYGYAWLRVYQRRPPLHRKIFSAATIVLASGAAQLAPSLAAPDHQITAPAIGTLTGPIALPAIVVAALLYWLIRQVQADALPGAIHRHLVRFRQQWVSAEVSSDQQEGAEPGRLGRLERSGLVHRAPPPRRSRTISTVAETSSSRRVWVRVDAVRTAPGAPGLNGTTGYLPPEVGLRRGPFRLTVPPLRPGRLLR